MKLELSFSGEIVERQELLNGTEAVTIDGTGGVWTVVTMLAWNLGLIEFAGEGDLTLARDDGAEIYATATSVKVGETTAEGLAFHASYEIDGGAGDFADASGEIEAEGRLSEAEFSGTWRVDLRDGP